VAPDAVERDFRVARPLDGGGPASRPYAEPPLPGQAPITHGAAGTSSVRQVLSIWGAHEQAYGRCRRGGFADAPTAPCKGADAFSHSLHRPSPHFYFVKNGDISISL
jgi:hypothetical protein